MYLEEWLKEDNTDENQSKYNVYMYTKTGKLNKTVVLTNENWMGRMVHVLLIKEFIAFNEDGVERESSIGK